MSQEDEIFLTIIGPESAMTEINKITVEGVEIFPPEPRDAMVDAVDSPLGPDEIQHILMQATVVLKFAATAVQFGLVSAQLAGELKRLLGRAEAHEKAVIEIRDGRTDAELIRITSDTKVETAGEAIKKAPKP